MWGSHDSNWPALYELLLEYESYIYCLYKVNNSNHNTYIGSFIGMYSDVMQAFADSKIQIYQPNFECLGYYTSASIKYARLYYILYNYMGDNNKYMSLLNDNIINPYNNTALTYEQLNYMKYILGCKLLRNNTVEMCGFCSSNVRSVLTSTNLLYIHHAIHKYNNVNSMLINIARGHWYKNIIIDICMQIKGISEMSSAIYDYHMSNKKMSKKQKYIKTKQEERIPIQNGVQECIYMPNDIKTNFGVLQRYITKVGMLYVYDNKWYKEL